jgi:hypothetical protein
MRDLYTTVVRHLKSQRDSAADLKLWDDLWGAYERSGAEGVAEIIDQIIELPNTEDEEQS